MTSHQAAQRRRIERRDAAARVDRARLVSDHLGTARYHVQRCTADRSTTQRPYLCVFPSRNAARCGPQALLPLYSKRRAFQVLSPSTSWIVPSTNQLPPQPALVSHNYCCSGPLVGQDGQRGVVPASKIVELRGMASPTGCEICTTYFNVLIAP